MCLTSCRPDVIRHTSQLHCISMNNTCIRTRTHIHTHDKQSHTKKKTPPHDYYTLYLLTRECVCKSLCANFSGRARFPRTCKIVNQTKPERNAHARSHHANTQNVAIARGNACDTLRVELPGVFLRLPSGPPIRRNVCTMALFEWFRIHFRVKFGSKLGESDARELLYYNIRICA